MAHKHEESKHHITPILTYVKVAGALFVLTILTVTAHQMELGALKAPVAFFIASIKAVLVMLWFMHLKDEEITNKVIFASGFFFLALLFALSAADIFTRVAEFSTL